ncbi:hypothetical protein [uncultured Nostoc sp.]|uniref:hypothetical protein n=1 Tax=uncultured Nostoc sp. TaxID=340711 RepID=UPI00261FBB40|nr:hypothetical protein [uncultured Nostoc sp.]
MQTKVYIFSQKINLFGKYSWENGCPVNGQAFFPVSEKYKCQLEANTTFQGKGKPLPSQ